MTDKSHDMDVVLMAGEGNMAGWGTKIEDIAEEWRGPIAGALIWRDGAWAPLAAGDGADGAAFGPELWFARETAAAGGPPLGVVKVAAYGSDLAEEWSADEDGDLLRRLIDETRAAIMGRTVRLRGLLWMQGESDAIHKMASKAYVSRFAKLVKRIRTELGAPEMPAIAGVIDPPLTIAPHAKRVQAALREPPLEHHASLECAGLPKQADDLHYSPLGQLALGQRFAARLKAFEAGRPPAPLRRWIYASDRYQAWYEADRPEAEEIVVTFPHAVRGDGFLEPGFGQRVFSRTGVAAVHIRASQSDWFQTEEIFEVARAIRRATPFAKRIVTYGVSMGAYGALLTSTALNADKVIAVSPQYTLDRAVMTGETRWKSATKRIGPFLHDIDSHISPRARKIVLFDPLSYDRAHVEMFRKDDSWTLARLPLSSHQVLEYLLEVDLLSLVLEDLFGDGPDIAKIRSLARRRRRDNRLYWLTLAEKLESRRPQIAVAALAEAAALGAPSRKIRMPLERMQKAVAAAS